MSRDIRILSVMAILSLCLPTSAQAAAPEVPDVPEIESVLMHIPTGAMGYLVVNDMAALSDNIDSFLTALQIPMPVSQDLLGSLQDELMLGDGFHPNGGVAFVLLNTEAFGIDLIEYFKDNAVPDHESDDEIAEKTILPLVIFVAGDSVDGVFGNYPISDEDGLMVIEMDDDVLFAKLAGDYVALSPRADALQAALDAKQRLTDVLRDKQLALLTDAGAAVHMDLRVCRPMLKDALESFAEAMEEAAAMAAATGKESPGVDPVRVADAAVAFYGALLDQMSSITIRANVDETGLRFGETIAFEPDSALGKIVSAQGPTDGLLLDRLPDLPYFLAFGSSMSYSPEMAQMLQDLSNDFMTSLDIPEDVIQQTQGRQNDFYANVKSVQFVLGGGPVGSGTLGMSIVYVCEDAQAIKDAIAEQIKLATGMMAAMAESTPGGVPEFTHAANALAIGGVSVDKLTVDMPESNEPGMEDMDAVFGAMLGSDTLDILIAAPDNETLVFTLGGGEAMMTEALTVADGSGSILASGAVADAMAVVPDEAWCVGLFSLKGLGEVIATTMDAVTPGSAKHFPLKFMTVETPIVFFMESETATLYAEMVIPVEPLQDAFTSTMQAMMMAAQEGLEDDEDEIEEAPPQDDPGF